MCSILLVLQNNDRIRVSDRCLQKTFGVFRTPWCNNFESRYASVPARVVLGMLCSNAGCKAIGTPESDVTRLYSTGHVMCFCGGIYDLVNGLHSEIKGHKFALPKVSDQSLPPSQGQAFYTYDRTQPGQCRPDGQPTEAGLRDWAVNNSFVTESIEQSLGDFISANAA